MNPNKRIALLKDRGISLSEIARQLDVKPGAVSAVNSGRGRSGRIQAAIAEACGLSVAQAFPDVEASTPHRHRLDAELISDIRQAMRMFGLTQPCELTHAIPRLRHVIGVYNRCIDQLKPGMDLGAYREAIRVCVEQYARPLIDIDDPQLFQRNWWEPLDSFAQADAIESRSAKIKGSVKIKRGTLLGDYNA
jgi:transcriptional regulator with XRE-family HTH domain